MVTTVKLTQILSNGSQSHGDDIKTVYRRPHDFVNRY